MTDLWDRGRSKHKWWPDWRGECFAVVASGPSIKQTDLSLMKDRIHVIAIKTAVDLCPWAEVCYGCDAAWWIDRKGLPKFGGLRIYYGQQASQYPNMHRVQIDLQKDEMLMAEPLILGNGGNSGFQALNLGLQFGGTDAILVGFDCHERGGVHWYGRNKWTNANNPMGTNYTRWIKGFELAKKSIARIGATVVNASPQSEIKAFPKQPLAEVMEEWGL
jgi:hypothetical protein